MAQSVSISALAVSLTCLKGETKMHKLQHHYHLDLNRVHLLFKFNLVNRVECFGFLSDPIRYMGLDGCH